MKVKHSKKVSAKGSHFNETKGTNPKVSKKIVEIKVGPFGRLAYKISEASRMIGVSENSVRRLIKEGQLKYCGKLRHILIPHSAIEEFLGIKDA